MCGTVRHTYGLCFSCVVDVCVCAHVIATYMSELFPEHYPINWLQSLMFDQLSETALVEAATRF